MVACVRGNGKLSRVALTAAKLGLTLDTAFKPRQVRHILSIYILYNFFHMVTLCDVLQDRLLACCLAWHITLHVL